MREDELTINKTIKFLEQQNALKTVQFDAVVEYITNTARCKSRLILDYFGETDSTDCGICSNCIASAKETIKPASIRSSVVEILKTGPHSSAELEHALGLTTEETVKALRILLEERKIKIDHRNFYNIA